MQLSRRGFLGAFAATAGVSGAVSVPTSGPTITLTAGPNAGTHPWPGPIVHTPGLGCEICHPKARELLTNRWGND